MEFFDSLINEALEITQGLSEINYEYDGKGRKTKVIIGGTTLFTYAYEDNVAFENNQFCNIVTEISNDGHTKRLIYDKRGKLLKVLSR